MGEKRRCVIVESLKKLGLQFEQLNVLNKVQPKTKAEVIIEDVKDTVGKVIKDILVTNASNKKYVAVPENPDNLQRNHHDIHDAKDKKLTQSPNKRRLSHEHLPPRKKMPIELPQLLQVSCFCGEKKEELLVICLVCGITRWPSSCLLNNRCNVCLSNKSGIIL